MWWRTRRAGWAQPVGIDKRLPSHTTVRTGRDAHLNEWTVSCIGAETAGPGAGVRPAGSTVFRTFRSGYGSGNRGQRRAGRRTAGKAARARPSEVSETSGELRWAPPNEVHPMSWRRAEAT